ncbi:MAG: TolC family protein [Flavobacterium sp.]
MRLILITILFLFGIKSFSQQRDLPYYLEKAQTHSPLLANYSNQIKVASLDSLLIRSGYKPQISGTLNAGYAPIINGYGYDTAITNRQFVTGLVGLNQKVLGKNRINSEAAIFQIIKESLLLNKKIAIKDLNKTITAQYITAWGTATQIDYNKKITTLLKEENDILKKLTQHSVYKQTDYLIFNAAVKQQEFISLQLHQQYQNDLALLDYLSGESGSDISGLKPPELTSLDTNNGENMFLRQFENDSLKIQNSNKLIDNNYKPSLSLLADAGYNSSFISQGYKNFGASVGLGMTIPIYDGNQRNLQYQKNEAAMETVNAYKINFQRQYKQQILMLNQKLQQSEQTASALQSQLIIGEALISADKKLILTGDIQITEYIIALSNLITVQDGITQNTISKLQLLNELNYWKSNK